MMRWSLWGTVETEKVAYAGMDIDGPSLIEDDVAEMLAIASATSAKTWAEASEQVDCRAVAALCERELILGCLHSGFTEFLRAREAENQDRAAVQLRTLDRHLKEQLARMQEILDRHRAANRASLVRATQGRIDALRMRCEQRRAQIEQRRQLNPSTEDIAVLLVEVT
jgi:hypothetical protein